MKIVVLTGSPRKNSNTNYMADRFIAGATEAGHDIFRFDCARSNVSGCIGCNHCNMNGPCIYDDDFTKLRPKLIEADLVAFVSPMYYFGFSSQLKRVVDRFYAINGQIKGASKKAVFMMAYADTSKSEAEAMTAHYKTLINASAGKMQAWSSPLVFGLLVPSKIQNMEKKHINSVKASNTIAV